MLSELNKLSKLIWRKKKCCDYKSWKCFFYSEGSIWLGMAALVLI